MRRYCPKSLAITMKVACLFLCYLAFLCAYKMTRRAEVLNTVQKLSNMFCPRSEPFTCDNNTSGIGVSSCCMALHVLVQTGSFEKTIVNAPLVINFYRVKSLRVGYNIKLPASVGRIPIAQVTCIPYLVRLQESLSTTRCLSGCSCDDQCGLYNNCCFRNQTSKVSLVSCLPTNTKSISKEDGNVPWYKFVVRPPRDGCIGAGSCIYPTKSIPWTTFNPVYSLTTKYNYVNEDCAKCHGITDGIKWKSSIFVDSVHFYNTDDILNILMTGNSNKLYVQFKHPIAGPEKFDGLCSKVVRNTCPIDNQNNVNTFLHKIMNRFYNMSLSYEESKDLCLNGPETNFFVKSSVFKNVYCVFCTSQLPVIDQKCLPDPKFGYRTLIQMIDLDISTNIHHAELTLAEKTIPKACKRNNAPRNQSTGENKTTCRVVFCPNLQARTRNGDCRLTAKTWKVHGIFIALRLTTPYHDRVNITQAFPNQSDEEIKHLLYQNTPWNKRWYIKNFGMRSYTADDSSKIEFVVHLIKNVTYIDPKRLLPTIRRTLKKVWTVQTFIGLLHFDQDFLEYGANLESFYRGNGITAKPLFRLDKYGVDINTQLESKINSTMRSLPLWDVLYVDLKSLLKKPLLIINKLFYCNQIELDVGEFDLVSKTYGIIWLKMYNKFLYSQETSITRFTDSESFKVKVCLADSGFEIAKAMGRKSGVDSVICVAFAVFNIMDLMINTL